MQCLLSFTNYVVEANKPFIYNDNANLNFHRKQVNPNLSLVFDETSCKIRWSSTCKS